MGQSTGRSESKMKAFLDGIEKKIDGDKEVKEGTRRHKVHSKKRSSKKTTSK